MVKISVIVPVYNVEDFIKKSICSLKEQTFTDFEVIIVDDGATDNSINIAQENTKNDPRFIYVSKINGGLSDARNFGINLAKGEYLAFLDSDDYYSPFFLEKMYNKIIEDNADICICDIELVKENYESIKVIKNKYIKPISGLIAFKDNLSNISISSGAQNKLFKKDLFSDERFPKGLYYEDRATTYKLFLKSKKITFLNEALFYYLQRNGSIMNGLSNKKLDDRFIVLDSIKQYLQKEGIFIDNIKGYICCYLLNVILSGSAQIAMYSTDYNKEIGIYLSRIDKKMFTIRNILSLRKEHFKKMIALLILKYNKKIFRYITMREKTKKF